MIKFSLARKTKLPELFTTQTLFPIERKYFQFNLLTTIIVKSFLMCSIFPDWKFIAIKKIERNLNSLLKNSNSLNKID